MFRKTGYRIVPLFHFTHFTFLLLFSQSHQYLKKLLYITIKYFFEYLLQGTSIVDIWNLWKLCKFVLLTLDHFSWKNAGLKFYFRLRWQSAWAWFFKFNILMAIPCYNHSLTQTTLQQHTDQNQQIRNKI